MTTLRIKGYSYTYKGEIDLVVRFYPYNTTFDYTSFTNYGNLAIDRVGFGFDANKNLCVIIGRPTSSWYYPEIQIESAEIGYSTPQIGRAHV